MELCDIWWTVRGKHGWYSDFVDAGYSKEQLDELTELEESYVNIDSDCFKFQKPFEIEETKDQPKNGLSNWEVERARNFPLYELLGVRNGERIPCPFHNGHDKNFMVKEKGYCFVCEKSCDSIGWKMEFDSIKFSEAVKSLLK